MSGPELPGRLPRSANAKPSPTDNQIKHMSGSTADSSATAAPWSLAARQSVPRTQEFVASLFEEARDDVYRYLLTLGLYPAQAQEATQEVFLRLYATLRKGEEIRNGRAWVFRVAHNYGLQVRAKHDGEQPFDPEWETTIRNNDRNPEQSMLEKERQVRLHQAIAGLSPQQRHCLHLRAEGLRYHEIAESIGVSVSTVSEFLRRAIARLRKATHE